MSQDLVPLEENRLMRGAPTGIRALQAMLAEAAVYVKSGLLPKDVNTPEKAVLIMAAGRELGIPATYALRNIHVIQGRPTCSAELMMALVQRDHGEDAIRVVESDNQHAVVVVRVGSHTARYTWTLADAEQAKLTQKDTWRQYPRAMLRSRAISEACRATFPGSIGGLYTPDELGAPVTVGADGAIDVLPQPAEPTAPPPDPVAPASEAPTPNRPGLKVLFSGTHAERKAQFLARCERELGLSESAVELLLGGLKEYVAAHPGISAEEVFMRLVDYVHHDTPIPDAPPALAGVGADPLEERDAPLL